MALHKGFDTETQPNKTFVMEIAFILGGLFLFCTIGFIAIALFIPELVGIQGRKAQEVEASQRGETPLERPPNPSHTGEEKSDIVAGQD